MSVSLYRKYRPQTFEQIVGQNHVKITLQNEIKRGTIAHAYLFCGPRGIGKTTSARLVAKAINCTGRSQDSSEPCEKCQNCTDTTAGKSLDVMEIDAASHTGVDNVRSEIIDSARFTPHNSKYKVFIIDEVHMLSTSAFNALLKILEEPPAHVVFILATTESHKIPATIISRCQRFDFRRVNFSDIVNHLSMIASAEKVHCDKEVLELIARRSEGYLRDAVSLLNQVLSLGEKKIGLAEVELVLPQSNSGEVFAFAQSLANDDMTTAVRQLNSLADAGVNMEQFANDVVEFFRRLLLSKIHNSLDQFAADSTLTDEDKLSKLLSQINLDWVLLVIDTFLDKAQYVKKSAIPQLPLELAVVKICSQRSAVVDQKLDAAKPEKKEEKGGRRGEEKEEEKGEEKKEDEEKKITVEKTAEKKNPANLEEINKIWPKLILALSDSNHSLALTLKIGQPLTLVDDQLTIGFAYGFHQERVSEDRNATVIEKVLADLLGKNLQVKAIVSDAVAREIEEDDRLDPQLGQVLEALGGELVSS